ncbi:MAG: ABC transporter ATP-binding protein [Pseudolabrys sp.]
MADGGEAAQNNAANEKPPLVRFEAVTKRFGSVAAIEALSLDIAHDEFFALLGPSGCGKTTLLRMLAGFETPTEGRILLDGEDIDAVQPHRRPVNMMFQSYALFPHLTVEGNIGFGLRQENVTRAEISERVTEMLALVRLQGFGRRRIDQLSGGQRQRVALARSLIKRPRVLLLDEPLAALDKKLRAETQFELMELQRRLGTTFVIVTHDQEEAMIVADRIAVMNHGRLMQVATPSEIYERPNSRWVADFIGEVTVVEGHISAGGAMDSALGKLSVAGTSGAKSGDTVWLALRPEKIGMSSERPAGELNKVPGTISEIGYRGDISIYKVRLADRSLMKVALANVSVRGNALFKAGDLVWLSWPPDAGVVLDS